jgi:hypothetical protein
LKKLRQVFREWQANLTSLAKTIEHNKLCLRFMDILEEFRDLSLQEWNFRQILKENLEKLLEQQMIYWMQRGRIKWVTLGDENTKFFHTTATIQHNKNSIIMLKDGNGQEKYEHEEKAVLLWNHLKTGWQHPSSHRCIWI